MPQNLVPFFVLRLLVVILAVSDTRRPTQKSLLQFQNSSRAKHVEVNLPANYFRIENSRNATLLCTVPMQLAFKDFMNVSWIKAPRQILTKGVFQVMPNSRFKIASKYIGNPRDFHLVIRPVLPEDEGAYRCTFRHGHAVYVRQVTLVVNLAPRFIDFPPELIVMHESQELTIQCRASGKPEPDIYWTREAFNQEGSKYHLQIDPIDNYPDRGIVIAMNGSMLRMSRLHRLMNGKYCCTAENSVNKTRKCIQLSIKYGPEVSMRNRVIAQKVARMTIIICEIEANPLGSVEWFFNKNNKKKNSTLIRLDVPKCSDYTASFSKYCQVIENPSSSLLRMKSSTLQIYRLTEQDFGEYICQVKSNGKTKSGVTLIKRDNTQSDLQNKITEAPQDTTSWLLNGRNALRNHQSNLEKNKYDAERDDGKISVDGHHQMVVISRQDSVPRKSANAVLTSSSASSASLSSSSLYGRFRLVASPVSISRTFLPLAALLLETLRMMMQL